MLMLVTYYILCIEKLFRYKMSKKLNKKLFIKLLIYNECLQICLTINDSIKNILRLQEWKSILFIYYMRFLFAHTLLNRYEK